MASVPMSEASADGAMDGEEPALVGAVEVEETVRWIGAGRSGTIPLEAVSVIAGVGGVIECAGR